MIHYVPKTFNDRERRQMKTSALDQLLLMATHMRQLSRENRIPLTRPLSPKCFIVKSLRTSGRLPGQFLCPHLPDVQSDRELEASFRSVHFNQLLGSKSFVQRDRVISLRVNDFIN